MEDHFPNYNKLQNSVTSLLSDTKIIEELHFHVLYTHT